MGMTPNLSLGCEGTSTEQPTSSSSKFNERHRYSSKRSSKRGRTMTNPYICESELDDLSPDDSIIDYAFISEDNFLLVLLLVTNGDLHAVWQTGDDNLKRRVTNLKTFIGGAIDPVAVTLSSDAAFIVVGLAEGDLLIISTRLLLDVSWGGGEHSWLRSQPILIVVASDRDHLLSQPTYLQCFTTKHPKRPTVVMTTKGGSIFVVDLESRKCVAELTAPQSIHKAEVVSDKENTDLLVTSFTGAQWIIPLENGGRGYAEVLATCIPSEFRQVEPIGTQLTSDRRGIICLKTDSNLVEVHASLNTIGVGLPKQAFKIPPDTWLAHVTNNSLFTVSNEATVRCAFYFGMPSTRLEYSSVHGCPEWRVLEIIPLAQKKGSLPTCMLINERGMVRIKQDPKCSLESVAAEFLFRVPAFSVSVVSQVAQAAGLDAKDLKSRLIVCLLANRSSRKLTSVELARMVQMAKAVELSLEQLLELFARQGQEDSLLPELLRLVETDRKSPLKNRVVELYAKKCLAAADRDDYQSYRQKKDGELSAFLSRHTDVTDGASVAVSVPLWKATTLLSTRRVEATTQVAEHVIREGDALWTAADPNTRSQMLSCVCQLDWSTLSAKDVLSLVGLLCRWQRDFVATVYHESCLRVAAKHRQKHSSACEILYLVSALYLLSEEATEKSSCRGPYRSVSCGQNSSIAVTFDDRLMIWGELSARQQGRQAEANDVPVKCARRGSSVDSHSVSLRKPVVPTLPRSVFINGRPHAVACGTEHAMVLTTAGQLFCWGNNRFGQCGVGHNQPVAEPQLVETSLPPIRQMSAGQFHSSVLCEDGSLWMWGWGLYGQLGTGGRSNADAHVPTRIDFEGEKIVSVSCGRVHTVLLTESGRILMSGGGAYGQSGSCAEERKVHTFTPVVGSENMKFTHVTTRFYHSLAVTTDGRLFEWGRNPQEIKMKMFVSRRLRNVQRGSSDAPRTQSQPPLPRELPRDDLGWREVHHLLDGPVAELSTGLSHSAVITDSGSLFTWGKALEYQLGHGNKSERSEPHQVFEPSDTKWKHVECGGLHTLAVGEDGRLFGWGRNDVAQCGMPSDAKGAAPRKYFYQAKEGAKRCVQLPDDSVFVVKPSLVPDVQVRLPLPGDPASMLDYEELLSRLRSSDLATLQMVSRHFLCPAPSPAVTSSLPVALCHLMAGHVEQALDQISRAVETNAKSPSLSAVCSLAWEVLANHEDCQSKSLLTKAFGRLPMTTSQKNGSQLRNLWPNVWDMPSCQKSLSAEEKLKLLEGWTAAVQPVNHVELPGASLRSGSSRVRVWAQCGHVEAATVGVASECSTCADEWRDKVMGTLGTR